MKTEQQIRAEIIADLYEARGASYPHLASFQENVHNAFQFQFLSNVIAKICDKYKISYDVIMETLSERGKKAPLSIHDFNS